MLIWATRQLKWSQSSKLYRATALPDKKLAGLTLRSISFDYPYRDITLLAALNTEKIIQSMVGNDSEAVPSAHVRSTTDIHD